jgi:hypothetical protein
MSTKFKRMQNLIRQYKDVTGKREVDMHEVAKFARENGWELPAPKSPIDLMAMELSRAARGEIRRDKQTGRPYRANHAYPVSQGNQQLHFWVDIDEASRAPMQKSLINRREQMVGDGLQLSFDAEHWNNLHPEEDPIHIELDFSEDIEWRKNGPVEQAG